jgi:hypothetical protein
VALERTAELSYGRLLELAGEAAERETPERIRRDEAAHAAVFAAIAGALDEDDHLRVGVTADDLAGSLGSVSEWFLPARRRASTSRGERGFASGAPVRSEQEAGATDVAVLEVRIVVAKLRTDPSEFGQPLPEHPGGRRRAGRRARLHAAADQPALLGSIAARLRPGGRLVVVSMVARAAWPVPTSI